MHRPEQRRARRAELFARMKEVDRLKAAQKLAASARNLGEARELTERVRRLCECYRDQRSAREGRDLRTGFAMARQIAAIARTANANVIEREEHDRLARSEFLAADRKSNEADEIRIRVRKKAAKRDGKDD